MMEWCSGCGHPHPTCNCSVLKSNISTNDLRYLSMLAWRQNTRQGNDIADRIDALLARRAARATSEACETDWIPPYVRVNH